MNPEKAFLLWFDALPPGQRQTLAYLYILMTSVNSGDFALTGDEALRRFHAMMRTPDFPIRRVARLVSVKGVFSFLLFDADFLQKYVLFNPMPAGTALLPLSRYQWLRSTVRWRRLCEQALSDVTLHHWLRNLSCAKGAGG